MRRRSEWIAPVRTGESPSLANRERDPEPVTAIPGGVPADADDGDLPVEPDKQRAILARMRGAAWLAVALTIWITWMGLRLTHTLSSQPPPVAHASP
jgi:hypothetical protein